MILEWSHINHLSTGTFGKQNATFLQDMHCSLAKKKNDIQRKKLNFISKNITIDSSLYTMGHPD